VLPGLYSGRTRHIHVRAKAPGRLVLTTQLFFPGVARNQTDALFDPDLLVEWTASNHRRARFDFALEL
jgi:protocatechuate 3,4-dioxygenase beta subunit